MVTVTKSDQRRFLRAYIQREKHCVVREMDSSGIAAQAPEHVVAISTNPQKKAKIPSTSASEDISAVATN